MERTTNTIMILLIIIFALIGCDDLVILDRVKHLSESTPTSKPIDEPTPVPTESPTPPAFIPTPVPTPVSTPVPTETPTPVPTETPTPVPTVTPTPVPTETPPPVPTPITTKPGAVWIIPYYQFVTRMIDENFVTELHLHSGMQYLYSYIIAIEYDPQVIRLNTKIGIDGVISGINGTNFNIETNPNSGLIAIRGVLESGRPPIGSDLHFLTINWTAIGSGDSLLRMIIQELKDDKKQTIGELPTPNNGYVVVK